MKGVVAFVICGFLAACLSSGVEHSSPPEVRAVLLRLDPPVGQVTQYRTTTETVSEMTGLPMDVEPAALRLTVFSTDSVCGAVGDVRHVLSVSDSVLIDAPERSMSPDQMEQLAERMKGWTVETRITTRGEVLMSCPPGPDPGRMRVQRARKGGGTRK